MLLETGSTERLLTELADITARVLSASCGVTTYRDDRSVTIASSDPLAAAVDQIQYDLGRGPCLQSLATGQTVIVPDMTDEIRWQPFPARVLSLGVLSSLSLPLNVNGTTVGAINLYARTAGALDDPDCWIWATALAHQASAVIGAAFRQAEQAQLTDQLRAALTSRAVIDQATGILMAQQRCDADTAFALLRQASQSHNRKVRDIAATIVSSVSGTKPYRRAT